MDERSRKATLGDIGENIVESFLRENGYTVERSRDRYDYQSDLYVYKGNEKYRIEVKTQPIYFKKKWLTIRESQLQKCLDSDILAFVTTPMVDYPNTKEAGCIYFARNPKKLRFEQYSKSFDGVRTRMIGFPIYQSGIKLEKKITDSKILNSLQNFRGFGERYWS